MKKKKFFKAVLLCLSFIFCLGLFVGCENKIEESPEEKERKKKIEVYKASQEFVKENLKAPATAEFPNFEDGKVVVAGDEKKYTVIAYVDAENSFGAKIRSKFLCNLKDDDNGGYEVEFVDINDDL
ncbi:hypothetical protein G8E05_10780 [Clostridium botulinum]|uniref:hypothetical protein n=1 Tax=Clostridium botulinum TaxID=1491 RepID=UPI00016BA52C|nr:hypothetical protein [Clostridium botulinum]AJD26861.1 putative lipoprotein [Clostridium botulinum CDC_297]EPS47078.1 hypothetical protein CFSAN002368_25637 [Clostridium botulinum A1 str. CFSAN002368]AJE10626.1 putative lipoprotein [Clostridium botulinum CDC_1436]EDT84575.1 putative lipoprotein [Clostridium botulinum Bf]MBY6878129.1 hypothetical protein [Clostridium botulinum]